MMRSEEAVRLLDAGGVSALEKQGTNCFRVAASQSVFADWWDGRVVISGVDDNDIRRLKTRIQEAAHLREKIRSTYLRRLAANPGPKDRPLLVTGDGEADGFEVSESGLRYMVNLEDGYSPGLFADQRENRLRLRDLAAERPHSPRVLNLFAYTCAFSVAAASEGAQVTSVDLSRRYLEIGKSNFERNGLSTREHRFVAEDVARYLPRLVRRGEKFDFIILDPPTFGRGSGGRVFRFERDFPELLALAVEAAAPGSMLLLSGNWHGLSLDLFHKWSTDVTGREPDLCTGPVPADFAGSPCSRTCWMHLT